MITKVIWCEENYAFLRKNNDKTTKELAEILGTSMSTICKMRKMLGLEKRPLKLDESKQKLMKCININEIRKLYRSVLCSPDNNGIDSEISCVAYQNNENDITIVTRSNGVLSIGKSDLKQFIKELQGIYEVYGE